ncbi:MAG: WYL domain-containing protein, partial [Phycisphaerae bacterium]|nr:WYL domain-containing protein [Phycisphaerae bacterium]
YVIGYSELHRSIRTFHLGRIQQAESLDRRFTDGEGFDVNEYLGRAWCLIPEGKLYDIKLKFSPLVARNVAEVQWHNTQRVQWADDSSAILTFRVDGLGEISWWILGYGDQVQVLAPAALRKRVLEKAQNFIRLHKKY